MDDTLPAIPERMARLAKEFDACRRAITALGDENRQQIILALLRQYSGMRVGELTQCTNLSRPAVSHHLKILKDAGIVSMFKVGAMHFYHVDANETQWRQMASLMAHVSGLVDEVSALHKAGAGCATAKEWENDE